MKAAARSLSVLSVSVVLVSMLVSCSSRNSSSAAAYYYFTEGELVVKRGDKTLTSIPQTFNIDDAQTSSLVVWTNSGKYLALVTSDVDPDPSSSGARINSTLVFIDTHSGTQHAIRCDCEIQAPAGDNDVLVTRADHGSSIIEVSPQSTTGGKELTLAAYLLPRRYSTGSGPVVLGQLGARLVTKQTWTPDLTRQQDVRAQFQLTPIDGSPSVQVVADGVDTYNVKTEISDPGSGGTSMAVQLYGHGNGCAHGAPVAIIDKAGKWSMTDISKAAPPNFKADVRGGMSITDLTWSPIDKRFHAGVDSWQCSGDGSTFPLTYASTNQRWVLLNNRWEHDSSWPQVAVARQLDSSSWLMLKKPDCQENPRRCNFGSASIQHSDGSVQPIAEDVIEVSVDPSRSD